MRRDARRGERRRHRPRPSRAGSGRRSRRCRWSRGPRGAPGADPRPGRAGAHFAGSRCSRVRRAADGCSAISTPSASRCCCRRCSASSSLTRSGAQRHARPLVRTRPYQWIDQTSSSPRRRPASDVQRRAGSMTAPAPSTPSSATCWRTSRPASSVPDDGHPVRARADGDLRRLARHRAQGDRQPRRRRPAPPDPGQGHLRGPPPRREPPAPGVVLRGHAPPRTGPVDAPDAGRRGAPAGRGGRAL